MYYENHLLPAQQSLHNASKNAVYSELDSYFVIFSTSSLPNSAKSSLLDGSKLSIVFFPGNSAALMPAKKGGINTIHKNGFSNYLSISLFKADVS